MKKAKPPYVQGSIGKVAGLDENEVNDYKQVEIERIINHHQRSNKGHTEKQQAEAAVHQHFEESLKLAQQQRVSKFFFFSLFQQMRNHRKNNVNAIIILLLRNN